VRGRVAPFAGQARVFPLEFVARLRVLEFFLRWLPVDQVEALSVVFQVAAHAIPAVRVSHLQTRVIALFTR